jgi:uncharacterized protein (TIGR01244 family)
MKHYIELNDQVSVSDQLEVADVAKLHAQGVQLMVCNRPDKEDEGQVDYSVLEKAGHKLGLDVEFLPFSSYQIDSSDRDKLVELLKRNQRTHLYCRSGARSKRLWRAANKIGRGGHDWHS